jgi:hypothetical protein
MSVGYMTRTLRHLARILRESCRPEFGFDGAMGGDFGGIMSAALTDTRQYGCNLAAETWLPETGMLDSLAPFWSGSWMVEIGLSPIAPRNGGGPGRGVRNSARLGRRSQRTPRLVLKRGPERGPRGA